MNRIILKLLLIAMLLFGVHFALTVWESSIRPITSNKLAVQQLNGGDTELVAMRTFERTYKTVSVVTWLGVIGVIAIVLWPEFKRFGAGSGSAQSN